MDNFLFIPRALIAALADIAFAFAVGISLSCFLHSGRQGNATIRRPILVCAATMLLAVLAQIYLTTATMIASAAPGQVLAQIRSVAFDTHAGRSLLATSTITLLLCILAAIPRTRWLTAATLILLAAARSTLGHAASDGDFTVAELVQFTHLLSTAIWSGLILAASFLTLPKLASEAIHPFTRKLSTTVTVSLVFLLASGAYNSYRGLGGALNPALHTQWGVLLCAKLLFVAAALALGLLNRRILHNNPMLSDSQIVKLKTQLRAEAILMLLILTLSAALANSPPAA